MRLVIDVKDSPAIMRIEGSQLTGTKNDCVSAEKVTPCDVASFTTTSGLKTRSMNDFDGDFAYSLDMVLAMIFCEM